MKNIAKNAQFNPCHVIKSLAAELSLLSKGPTNQDVLQFHLQHICVSNIFFPVFLFLSLFSHVIQDQFKKDDLLRNGAECIIKAEHVVTNFSLYTTLKKGHIFSVLYFQLDNIFKYLQVTHTWNLLGQLC